MNFQEIIDLVSEHFESVDEFAYATNFDGLKTVFGEVEEIHQEGGEGCGDHWESVKHFKDHDVYIRVVGSYTSHHGTDFYEEWDCCSEVRPQQKTITVYE